MDQHGPRQHQERHHWHLPLMRPATHRTLSRRFRIPFQSALRARQDGRATCPSWLNDEMRALRDLQRVGACPCRGINDEKLNVLTCGERLLKTLVADDVSP